MLKIFTSALWWNAVNRPKRRGRRTVFSSIFGSLNNGINKGCERVSCKGRNPLARKKELFWKLFDQWQQALLLGQRICIFKHHLCGQYANHLLSLSEDRIAVKYSLFYFDISNWAASYLTKKDFFFQKVMDFFSISLLLNPTCTCQYLNVQTTRTIINRG